MKIGAIDQNAEKNRKQAVKAQFLQIEHGGCH